MAAVANLGWSIPTKQTPQDAHSPIYRLKSVAESGILLMALQQSRKKWTNSMLPKFTTSKQAKAIIQDPHSVHDLGTADVAIGPHTFAGTSFYEIRWSDEAPASTSTPAPSSEGLPPLSQSLSNRLNSEAAKDKLLMGILQRVTAKQATPQESSALNRYIIALRTSMLSTPRSPSLVLEFLETAGERFLLPSALLAVSTSDGIDLNFHLVPPSTQDSTPPAVPVTMQLSNVPQQLSDTLPRLSAQSLTSIPDQPRVYLQLQSVDKAAAAATQKNVAPSTTLNVSSASGSTKAKKAGAKTASKKKSLPGDKTPVDGKRPKAKPKKKDSSTAKGKGKEKVKSKEFIEDMTGDAEMEVEGVIASIKAKPTKRQSSSAKDASKGPVEEQHTSVPTQQMDTA